MCVYYHARRRHEYLGKGGDNGGKVFPGQIASWPWRADREPVRLLGQTPKVFFMELLNGRFANRVVGGQWESKVMPHITKGKRGMNSKSNIVTSAADGCGQPSSIRTMDNLPSRNHKGAEYKESFMFSSRSSVSRGYSLAAKVAIAGAVVAAMLGMVAFAAANTVCTPIGFTFSSSSSGDIADVVVENTASAGSSGSVYTSYVTTSIDGGGNVLYESGLAGAPLYNGQPTGLPVGGNFSSLMNTVSDQTTFQLLPYTGNNAFVAQGNNDTGTMTLITPTAYTSLAIMSMGGGGSAGTPPMTLTFTNGDSVVTDFAAPDWFAGTSGTTLDGNVYGVALKGFNRVNEDTGVFDTTYPSNPNIYQTTLNLADLTGSLNGGAITSGLNLTGDILQSVMVQRVDTSTTIGRLVVFGLSGSAVPEPSSILLLLAGLGGLGMLALARRGARRQIH